MKILIFSDPHLEILGRAFVYKIDSITKKIENAKADACVGLGDMDSGLHPESDHVNHLLRLHPYTVWVLGNHDLWNSTGQNPSEAMAAAVRRLKNGNPLETSWSNGLVLSHHGVTFIGSMGFPDFQHPRLLALFPKEYYDKRSATNDSRYINLKGGWLKYTNRMQKAFEKRLQEAFAGQDDLIVVATHYPILEAQSALRTNDEGIWAYFFNWTMGQMVLAQAEKHPKKKVLCLAGHSHEYCTGLLQEVAPNVWAYGAQGSYNKIMFWLFNTETWEFENI